MASAAGIERGNSHEPVDARFRAQVSKRLRPFDVQTGTFDTRYFPFLVLEHRDAKVIALGPSGVHPKQHLRPVLTFGTSRAGMNRQNAIPVIVRTIEHIPKFQPFEIGTEALHFPADFLIQIGVLLFLGQQKKRLHIFGTAFQDIPIIEPALLGCDLFFYGPRTVGVVPEVWIETFLIQTLYFLTSVIDVKDTLRAC